MQWHGNGMDGWDYALMTLSTVAFWTLVIAGVVALVHYCARRPSAGDGGWTGLSDPGAPQVLHSNPEQLLAERFARGEIDEHEFYRAMDVLRQHYWAEQRY
jgi:putative membrane protein